jgi:hypothetical protein
MKPVITQTQSQADDPHIWIGGEATVGSQAEHHVRRREGRVEGLFTTIITLTFIGGLILGGALSQLWRNNAK